MILAVTNIPWRRIFSLSYLTRVSVAVAVVLLAVAWAGRDSSSSPVLARLCRLFPPSPAPLSPELFVRIGAALGSCSASLSSSGPAVVIAVTTTTTTHRAGELATAPCCCRHSFSPASPQPGHNTQQTHNTRYLLELYIRQTGLILM